MTWKKIHIILLTLVGFFIAQHSYCHEYELFCRLDNISIEGKTNVNNFEFIYDSSNAKRVHIIEENQTEKSFYGSFIKFELPVKAFESNNKKMNRDFYQMLNASHYPEIYVKIKTSKLKKMSMGKQPSSLGLELTLAGITKTVESRCYYLEHFSGNKIIMKGITKINLHNFSLKPPKKMLGLVRVNETIFINFEVALNKNT
jgi:hypothetical protein